MNEEDLQKKLVEYRRHFHENPELSWKEEKTAEKICEILSQLGIKFQSKVGGLGIVATIPGQRKGPFVALRADMDALPIVEETGLSFSSKNEGVMHACAHDGHMSILLGAAEILSQGRTPPLPIRLVFQPAEETATGALAMIQAGVLEDVRVIFGGHLDRHYPTGEIIVSTGPVQASTDEFEVMISGQSGHGARPHETVDSIVVGGLMLMSLQTIVSREVDPSSPSVVSIGEFHAGTASNVIAGEAVLRGTIRAQDDEVREQLVEAVERIARSAGALHGAKVSFSRKLGTPSVHNSEAMAAIARMAAANVVGSENVGPLRKANMGGEDFAYYLQEIEGAFVRYGAHEEGKDYYPAHSSKFDFDERALIIGAKYLSEVALQAGELLAKESEGG